MKVTAAFDVLSHWCLAAWPAYERAVEMVGPSNVRLLLAPIGNGFPMGMPPEAERWFYTRGTRAYGMTLDATWYETDRTTTLWANAAVVAAAALGADLAGVAHAAMESAMKRGEMLGRRDVAVATVARLAGLDPAGLSDEMERASTGRALNEANAALAAWHCAERPSWRLENANGDFVVMQGVWHRAAIEGSIDALSADEAAYRAAGAPP
jgi:2-hydroxychromene-2-carboxylate isomerase